RTAIGIEDAAGRVGLPYMSAGTTKNGARFRTDYAVLFEPSPLLDCSSPTVLQCNQVATAYSNTAGANRVNAYNCAGGTFDGNERVFSLDVPTFSDVTVTLANTDGRDRSLFLLRPSCSEVRDCLAGGTTT